METLHAKYVQVMYLNVSSNYLNHTAKQSENLLAETKNGLKLLSLNS